MNHALSRMKNKKRKLHPQGRSQEFSRGKEGVGGGNVTLCPREGTQQIVMSTSMSSSTKNKGSYKEPPPPRSFLPSYALDRVKSLLIHEVRFLK